jgi:hypothetical protein
MVWRVELHSTFSIFALFRQTHSLKAGDGNLTLVSDTFACCWPQAWSQTRLNIVNVNLGH